MTRHTLLALLLLTLSHSPAHAATDLTSTLSLLHMKDQFRGANGQSAGALFQNTALALWSSASWELSGPFSLGAFVLVERGTRTSSDFAGVDSNGTPQVSDKSGGPYTQLWIGPMARLRWRAFFLDLGYVLYGIRKDEGRAFLPSATGDRESAFRSEGLRAWLAGVGGAVALTESLDLVLRLEFRYHYYDDRGGEPLQNDLHFGTQAIRPHLGVLWRI